MSEALHAVLAELTPQQAVNFTKAVHAIAAEAQKRFGVLPSLDEVMATAMVKAATYDPDGAFDMSNALYQLAQCETVTAHAAAKEGGAVPVAGPYRDSGVLSEEDIAGLPAAYRDYVRPGQTVEDIAALPSQLRMSISRALAMPETRHPTLRDVRDKDVASYEDGRDISALSGAERMARARREAQQ